MTARVLLSMVAFAALSACAPAESDGPEEPGQSAAAIVGGTTALGDPEVFMLLLSYDNGTHSSCSATLVGERTLLTAAHCVDPRIANASSVEIRATNRTYALATSQSDQLRATRTGLHPGWSPSGGSLEFDLALLLLEAAPVGVRPREVSEASLSGYQGRPLRALGYGTTGAAGPSSAGVKRSVDLTFRSIDPTRFFLGDGEGKGVCQGDSGGPSLHSFADGVERLVGVHSFTVSPSCVDGADVRVDAFAPWIRGWIAQHEGAQCARDGACRADCAAPDQDCVCVADGLCSGECERPRDDPDCPTNCGLDGVCQGTGCASPDPDCVPDGEPCSTPVVCEGGRCVTDPQRAFLYCSRPCAEPTDCGRGMTCERGDCAFIQLPIVAANAPCVFGQSLCVGQLVCSGLDGAATRCVAGCAVTADCPRGATCEDGAHGRFCYEPPREPIILRAGRAEAEVASRCAVSGGGPGLLGLAAALGALIRRLRRR